MSVRAIYLTLVFLTLVVNSYGAVESNNNDRVLNEVKELIAAKLNPRSYQGHADQCLKTPNQPIYFYFNNSNIETFDWDRFAKLLLEDESKIVVPDAVKAMGFLSVLYGEELPDKVSVCHFLADLGIIQMDKITFDEEGMMEVIYLLYRALAEKYKL